LPLNITKRHIGRFFVYQGRLHLFSLDKLDEVSVDEAFSEHFKNFIDDKL
jgi:hypothetical protein